jgi:hypothetical protein
VHHRIRHQLARGQHRVTNQWRSGVAIEKFPNRAATVGRGGQVVLEFELDVPSTIDHG